MLDDLLAVAFDQSDAFKELLVAFTVENNDDELIAVPFADTLFVALDPANPTGDGDGDVPFCPPTCFGMKNDSKPEMMPP